MFGWVHSRFCQGHDGTKPRNDAYPVVSNDLCGFDVVASPEIDLRNNSLCQLVDTHGIGAGDSLENAESFRIYRRILILATRLVSRENPSLGSLESIGAIVHFEVASSGHSTNEPRFSVCVDCPRRYDPGATRGIKPSKLLAEALGFPGVEQLIEAVAHLTPNQSQSSFFASWTPAS